MFSQFRSQSQYAEDHSTLQIPKSTESIVARSGEKGQYYVGQYYFSAPDGHIYWIRYIYDESGFHPEIGEGANRRPIFWQCDLFRFDS